MVARFSEVSGRFYGNSVRDSANGRELQPSPEMQGNRCRCVRCARGRVAAIDTETTGVFVVAMVCLGLANLHIPACPIIKHLLLYETYRTGTGAGTGTGPVRSGVS